MGRMGLRSQAGIANSCHLRDFRQKIPIEIPIEIPYNTNT